MIVSFSVKNFGSIKDKVTLSFEARKSKELEDYYLIKKNINKKEYRLLKLIMLYGPNASGKSTILKAMNFLRNLVLKPAKNKAEELDFEPFLFDPETPKQNSEIELDFFVDNHRFNYLVVFNKKAILKEELYKSDKKKSLLLLRTTNIEKQFTKIEKSHLKNGKSKILESFTLWNTTVLGAFSKANIDDETLKVIYNWFNDNLMEVISGETDLTTLIWDFITKEKIDKNKLLKIISEADFSLVDLNEKETWSKSREELLNSFKKKSLVSTHLIKEKEYYQLNFGDESKGTQRYFGLAGLLSLMIKNPKIVLIDEIEASIHPDLVWHFLLTFLVNTKNSQLVASTHLRDLLAEEDSIRTDSIWFTELKEDRSTDLFSLADYPKKELKNIYQAYKIGKYGAKPKLKDYYLDLED